MTIEPFLAHRNAVALTEALASRDDWLQVMNSGDKLFELDRKTRAEMRDELQAEIDRTVYSTATRGFQYRYETIRVPDEPEKRANSDDVLAAYASFLSKGEGRDFLRAVTSDEAIAFADVQATCYCPGDFLTRHDDFAEGKNRSSAHILSLSPEWRFEWGGLLLLHDEQAGEAVALLPVFNRMTLLRVPQTHSVGEVSRSAAAPRYSLTGWLRR